MKHTEQDKLINQLEVAIYDLKTENNRLRKALAELREDRHAEQDQPIHVNADRDYDAYNNEPDYPFGTNTSFEGWDGVRDGKEGA